MKTTTLIFTLFILTNICKSQITLEHSYPAPSASVNFNVVNLANSGYKYYEVDYINNTVNLYNSDHSLWKTINLNITNGYTLFGVVNISETLFNTDALVEVLYYYGEYQSGYFSWEAKISNENGTVVLTIPNCAYVYPVSTGTNGWKLLAQIDSSTASGVASNDVYSLPGSLPAMVMENKGNNPDALSMPYPNPSQSTAIIEYHLPEGVNSAEIAFFSLDGKEVKRFKVNNTFNTLELNNSNLPAGTYLYNLITPNDYSSAKKMIVIK